MATPTINLELLTYFSPILLWLLVFAIVYAAFQWAKILGDNKVLHAIIAILISLFVTVFSQGARDVIKFIIPWFTVLGIFMVFAIMLYKIFGATDDDVRSVIKGRPDVQWTLFIIVIIIMLGALSQAFGQRQLSYTTGSNLSEEDISENVGIFNVGNPGTSDTTSGDFNQNMGATFYHPKVLGTLFLFIMGALAVAFLSRPVVKT